jgi:hypothetical protein
VGVLGPEESTMTLIVAACMLLLALLGCALLKGGESDGPPGEDDHLSDTMMKRI